MGLIFRRRVAPPPPRPQCFDVDERVRVGAVAVGAGWAGDRELAGQGDCAARPRPVLARAAVNDTPDSAQIRAEQVERNRRRFGSDDYPGGNIPGVGWDRLGQLAEADVIPIRPVDEVLGED